MSENEATIWREYRLTGDHYFRDKLIERYLPSALALARKKAVPRRVDREDLESAAVIGLIQAVERYDPARGNTFFTYAYWRIDGALQDHLRTAGQWRRRNTRKRRELELLEWREAEPRVEEPTAELEREESFERYSRLFLRDDREREMARLHYRDGDPLHAVGAHFGITESRVCQILKIAESKALGLPCKYTYR